MFAQIMTSADIAMWPTTALVIFVAFMTAVFLWIMRPNAKQIYKKISEDILKDVEVNAR